MSWARAITSSAVLVMSSFLEWSRRWLLCAFQPLNVMHVLLEIYDKAVADIYGDSIFLLNAEPRKRVAVVTDACAGLGREMAKLLARQGYDLLLVSSCARSLRVLQQELHREPVASLVSCLVADLMTAEGRDRLIQYVETQELEVDVFIDSTRNSSHSVSKPPTMDVSTAIAWYSI